MTIWITGIGLIKNTPRDGAHFVPDEELAGIQESPQVRRMSRVSQFALAAAQRALQSAKCDLSDQNAHDEIGVVCASTHLSTPYGLEFHKGFLQDGKPMPGPIYFSNGCLNAVGSHISLEYKLTGCNHTLVGGMNAGLHALGVTMRLLEDGPCKAMLCVASEELSEILLDAYKKFRMIPPMTAGEGAAAFFLETSDHAKARGARPLAEILKFHTARSSNVRRDIEGRGMAKAIEAVSPQIGATLYSSCANNTDLDTVEQNGIRSVLPETIRTITPKQNLGEGFAFTSAAQVVALIENLSTDQTGLACSFDRQGDVSAISLRRLS